MRSRRWPHARGASRNRKTSSRPENGLRPLIASSDPRRMHGRRVRVHRVEASACLLALIAVFFQEARCASRLWVLVLLPTYTVRFWHETFSSLSYSPRSWRSRCSCASPGHVGQTCEIPRARQLLSTFIVSRFISVRRREGATSTCMFWLCLRAP